MGAILVLVGEDAVPVIEDHQRAGVLGPLRRAFIAACHEHHMAAVGCHAHLVRVDASVHRALRHLFPGGEILVHAIHTQRTGVVERHQYVLRFVVECHVDRPHGQAHRIANLIERTRGGIDPERRHVVCGADLHTASSAVARSHIQIAPVAMRPAVLHASRQCHRVTFDQFRVGEIDVVVREHRPNIGIQRQLTRAPLRESQRPGDSAPCK